MPDKPQTVPELILWRDSYGAHGGWQEQEEGYTPSSLLIESVGWVIAETETDIALSPNHAEETEDTPRQNNGVIVIPKCAITRRTPLIHS